MCKVSVEGRRHANDVFAQDIVMRVSTRKGRVQTREVGICSTNRTGWHDDVMYNTSTMKMRQMICSLHGPNRSRLVQRRRVAYSIAICVSTVYTAQSNKIPVVQPGSVLCGEAGVQFQEFWFDGKYCSTILATRIFR